MASQPQSTAEIQSDDCSPKETRQLLRILPARVPLEGPADHQQSIYSFFQTPYDDGS